MPRSTKQKHGSGVSLFPFLAVLLCTMGALIVLLVAMSYAARERAIAEASAEREQPAISSEASEETAKRLALIAKANKQTALLEQKAAEADARLRDDQLRLSQIEGHIRRLESQVQAHRAAVAELQKAEESRLDDRAQAERSLRQLREMIDETKQEIAELRDEQNGLHKSYAVVPYRGANGTQRKPIYIECLADQVLLQPEGVDLTEDDFRRPLGVGNPLAAALRATRDHHARRNPDAGYDPDAEPYPLIIVRPEGIELYYRVREAIRSWDSDFGYEMVDADWDLDFSLPDPSLSYAQQTAIEHARIRRRLLAKAAPRAYVGGRMGGAGGRQGEGSGGLPYDGSTISGGQASGANLRGSSGRGAGSDAPTDVGEEAFFALGEQPLDDTYGSEGQGGEGPRGEGQAARPGEYAPAGQGNPSGAAGPDGGLLANDAGDATDAAGPPLSQGSLHQTQAGAGSPVPPPASNALAATGSASGQAGAQSSSSGGGGGGGDTQQRGGASVSTGTVSFGQQPSGDPAGNQQGTDWALEKRGPGAIAIRRTVGVVVRGGELVVLNSDKPPAPGEAARGEVVALDGPTRGGLGQFVGAMQRRVRSWGMAGDGLYWRPVLKLHIAPDGATRAQDLVRLLDRSGIEISHTRTATPANPQRGPHATR